MIKTRLLAITLIIQVFLLVSLVATPQKEQYNQVQAETGADDVVIITDIIHWQHPVKAILGQPPYNLYKLELRKNRTYPLFYVQYPALVKDTDGKGLTDLLTKIAIANGFWDYELKNETSNLTIQVQCDKETRKVSQILIDGNIYFQSPQSVKLKNKFDVPQRYQAYVESKKILGQDDYIVFFGEADLDLDGNMEIVIATGQLDQDPISSYIPYVILLREKNEKIEELSKNLWELNRGYGIYEVKLIRVQSKAKPFIYFGLTNGLHLRGFEIIEVSNNWPRIFCYSASGTGAGNDSLEDCNGDGQVDSYVQHRWSYDVFYYEMFKTFKLKDGVFVPSSTEIALPEYPQDAKETVLQYLALRVLNVGDVPGVAKRLAELCAYLRAKEFQFPEDIWRDRIMSELNMFNNNLKMNIKITGNQAVVTCPYLDKNKIRLSRVFTLTKTNNRWRIVKIN